MINTAKSRERGSPWFFRGSSASGLGALVSALLVPKCPFCVAAWLTVLGISAPFASAIAPFIRPLLFGSLVALLVSWLIVRLRRRHSNDAGRAPSRARAQPRSCCK